MDKVEFYNIVTGSPAQVNSNFAIIKDELNGKVLYRDSPEGTPNQMLGDLDMNSQRILNLPTPINDSDPVRLLEVKGLLADTAEGVLTLNKLVDRSNHVRDVDIARISTMARSGGLRVATLGDSIKAGIGSTGSSSYGECATMLNQADTNLFAYSLMYADPNFVMPTDDIYPTQKSFSSGGSSSSFNPLGSYPLPNWQITKSKNSTISFGIKQDFSIASNAITIYFVERNSAAAAKFQVTAYDDTTQVDTWTVDTFVENPTYTGISTQVVDGRIGKFTRILPSSVRNLRIVIDSPDVLLRNGYSLATDGTAVIFGATVGNGVLFKNLAVSSTTLLNSSDANVSRGVTTSERLQKAFDIQANTFFIGFGTNDSKDGVSTVSAFISQYTALINTIRTYNPQAVIVICTAPRGLATPYLNNYIYNAAARQVAFDNKVSLIDYEDVAKTSPLYNDDVHPTRAGYDQMHSVLCSAFGIPSFRSKFTELKTDSILFPKLIQKVIAGGTSGTTLSPITTLTANRVGYNNIRIRLKLVFASTTAFNASLVRIKMSGYTGLDGTGSLVGSEVVLDESVFSAPLVSGTAILPYYTEVTRVFSDPATRSVLVTVEGTNWGLRNTNGTHYLEIEFTPIV